MEVVEEVEAAIAKDDVHQRLKLKMQNLKSSRCLPPGVSPGRDSFSHRSRISKLSPITLGLPAATGFGTLPPSGGRAQGALPGAPPSSLRKPPNQMDSRCSSHSQTPPSQTHRLARTLQAKSHQEGAEGRQTTRQPQEAAKADQGAPLRPRQLLSE